MAQIDHAAGAEPFRDINPDGPTPEQLPHRYVPNGPHDGPEYRSCCQFTAGRVRCKASEALHRTYFRRLYAEDNNA